MITIRILLEKPGYPRITDYVDIPVKFMENDQLRDKVQSGYYYAGAKVIEHEPYARGNR
jgi:hypothetical protein